MDRNLFDRGEILRYMGMGDHTDPAVDKAIDACIDAFSQFPDPCFTYQYRDITFTEDGVRLAHGFVLQGDSIRAHLKDCTFCGVLAATLGVEADRFIRRAQVADMVLALAADACATCAVESVCDKIQQIMAEENGEMYSTFRFSPGYGDLPIAVQKDLLAFLDTQRRIGLTCTDHCLLTPAKSVTAIVGFAPTPLPRHRRGCAVCSLRETCSFRKKGESCGS